MRKNASAEAARKCCLTRSAAAAAFLAYKLGNLKFELNHSTHDIHGIQRPSISVFFFFQPFLQRPFKKRKRSFMPVQSTRKNTKTSSYQICTAS